MHPTKQLKKSIRLTILTLALSTITLNMTGCQTLKKNQSAVASAENTEQGYYQNAINAINKKHYTQAIEALTNLRTFYPTGIYSEQALLDLIYAQFEAGEYETSVASAERFIRLYPNSPQVSYAYYVRGVANMQGSSKGFSFFKLNQAERDTAYLRLAFANFQELINKYPNSPYAPDSAQRMIYIYNQLALNELSAARWYIKRHAYVAAANRAKWVFQYFPQSESVPESIAILAYSNEKLGLQDLANNYKNLLRINYPNWLDKAGNVQLNNHKKHHFALPNLLKFGKNKNQNTPKTQPTPTSAPEFISPENSALVIKPQEILQAPEQIELIPLPKPNQPNHNVGFRTKHGINLGLGLPENDPSMTPNTDTSTNPNKVNYQNNQTNRPNNAPNQPVASPNN